MQISYTYENVNLLIVLIGVIIIIHLVSLRKMENRTIKFANYEILKKVIGREILHKNYLPLLLRLLAMILIIISISNLTVIIIKDASNVDYVFAIDSSSSMLTSDNGTFDVNRLNTAKNSVAGLLDNMPHGTRIGIVTFAGKSYVKSQPTNDYIKLKQIIRNISFETTAGTAIGDALITSAGLLTNSSKKRVVSLVTDGGNNRGMALEDALEYIIGNNITVYTIGVGTNKSAQVADATPPIPEELKGMNATAAQVQGLNETELRYIANQTNGRYFFVTNAKEMDSAFERAVLESNTTRIPLAKYVLLVAALVLIIEWGLGATKYKTIP